MFKNETFEIKKCVESNKKTKRKNLNSPKNYLWKNWFSVGKILKGTPGILFNFTWLCKYMF